MFEGCGGVGTEEEVLGPESTVVTEQGHGGSEKSFELFDHFGDDDSGMSKRERKKMQAKRRKKLTVWPLATGKV